MMLEASGMLAVIKNLHDICTVLRGEYLQQFDNLCDQVGSTNKRHLN